MTQKELLYFEDAISHEDIITKIIRDNLISIQDDNIISFMNNELNIHQNLKKDLMRVLEGKTNG